MATQQVRVHVLVSPPLVPQVDEINVSQRQGWLELSRVPQVGEVVLIDDQYYKVGVVLHYPNGDDVQIHADLWAHRVVLEEELAKHGFRGG